MNGLILGSSSGLGNFCANKFVAKGDKITGVARKQMEGNLYDQICVDLTDFTESKNVMKSLFSQKTFDYLLFSVGRVISDNVNDVDPAALSGLFQQNVASLLLPLKEFVAQQPTDKPRAIVLISSVHARGEYNRLSYSITKSGLEAIVRSNYEPLAQKKIAINCIRPGPIQSRMLDQAFPNGSEERDVYLKKIPAGRFAQYQDVWRHVEFFTSTSGIFTTGQCVEVSGGY